MRVAVAEAEVEPGVAGRQVAAAADPLGDLAAAGRGERHARADGVAVGAGGGPSSLKVTKWPAGPWLWK